VWDTRVGNHADCQRLDALSAFDRPTLSRDAEAVDIAEFPATSESVFDQREDGGGVSSTSHAVSPVRTNVLAGPRRLDWPLVRPLGALLVLTALFQWTPLDIGISRCFFDAEQQSWPWFDSAICWFFYRVGTYPAFVLAACGGLWAVGALVRTRTWHTVQPGLFLATFFLLGPGLIVNIGFKDLWGRPRPLQVQEFGGRHAFVPVGTPGPLHRHNSSFPSGHASVAFYLIAPAFLIGAKHRRLAHRLLMAGLIYGTCMGAVRVVQGGHFASDVLWSGAIVYFTGAVLAPIIFWLSRPRALSVAPPQVRISRAV
jgi:lipid A 4'-phosphatase